MPSTRTRAVSWYARGSAITSGAAYTFDGPSLRQPYPVMVCSRALARDAARRQRSAGSELSRRTKLDRFVLTSAANPPSPDRPLQAHVRERHFTARQATPAPDGADAFNGRPLSRASRPFMGPIFKARLGSI